VSAGASTTCGCGDTVTTDYILTSDLYCVGDGLKVGTGVTLDCGSYELVGQGSGTGIEVVGDDVTVKDCVIRNFWKGIYASNHDRISLVDNHIIDIGEDAIAFWTSQDSAVQSNEIDNAGWSGIGLHYTRGSTFTGNDVDTTSNNPCLNLEYETNTNVVEDNTLINSNQDGLRVDKDSDDNLIEGNTITDNSRGIGIWTSNGVEDNEIRDNIICANGQDIIVFGGQSTNHGEDNTCDTTSDWNDKNTNGCTHPCSPPTTVPPIPTPEYPTPIIPITAALAVVGAAATITRKK
jgi:parallel beta-helix repeat protein